MQILNTTEVEMVSGGLKWEGNRESTNVIDCRGLTCETSTGTDWGRTFAQWGVKIEAAWDSFWS